MVDQKAEYQIDLGIEGAGEAESAAKALEHLEAAIKGDTRELGAMQRALKNLSAATAPNTDQINKLKSSIVQKKEAVAAAQSQFIALGGEFKKAAKSGGGFEAKIASVVQKMQGAPAEAKKAAEGARTFGARLEALTKNAGALPGPLGKFVSQLGNVRGLLRGGLIAAGVAAIAAALAALVVATIAATRQLYKYGVAQADARRSELLRLEGLTKLRFLYQRIPGNAQQMQGALDRVAAKVPAGREALAKYNDQLYKMGMRGPALEKALEGVGLKLSVQGEEAASAFAGWAAGVNMTGGSIDKLVDKVRSRLGGIAAKQMTSLTVQAEKQKEAFDALFTGLDMDQYLAGWASVNGLLTQATASGRALKAMVTAILQPLIDGSTKATPIIKRFFQGMIIAALQFGIVVLTIRNLFKKTFGDSTLFEGLDVGRVAVLAGKAALYGLAFALGVSGLAATALSFKLGKLLIPLLWKGAVATFAALGPFLAIALAIGAVGYLVYTLIKYWDDLVIAFQQLDWLEAGLDIIEGIVRGMIGAPIYDKMKELALGALDTFKEALGITSPSKAFAKLGLEIPAGVAKGVESNSQTAEAASAGMLSASTPQLGQIAPPSGERSKDGGGGAAARGGNTITIQSISVHAASDKPEQLARDFRRELERELEGLLLETGGTVPA